MSAVQTEAFQLIHVLQSGQEVSQTQQLAELRLPEKDAEGLAAYLHLFARIFSTASLQDLEAWSVQLETQTNRQPLWSVFFQLMCTPVPQVNMLSLLKICSLPYWL